MEERIVQIDLGIVVVDDGVPVEKIARVYLKVWCSDEDLNKGMVLRANNPRFLTEEEWKDVNNPEVEN